MKLSVIVFISIVLSPFIFAHDIETKPVYVRVTCDSMDCVNQKLNQMSLDRAETAKIVVSRLNGQWGTPEWTIFYRK